MKLGMGRVPVITLLIFLGELSPSCIAIFSFYAPCIFIYFDYARRMRGFKGGWVPSGGACDYAVREPNQLSIQRE